MQTFEWVRPKTTDEAYAAFMAHSESRYLAGGMTLIPTMKLGLITLEHLVDLSTIPELTGITRTGDNIEIGALSRHCDVARSDLIQTTTPGLSILASGIGDRQVRNRGTIGGSVANSDPAACYPSAMLGLEATIKTNQRTIPTGKFFKGLFETALEPGEILTGVRFQIPSASHYLKFQQKASRFALVGVFTSISTNAKWRIAVTGAADHVFRVPEFEDLMNEGGQPEAFTEDFTSPSLNSDMHASADYRRHLVRVIAGRAITQLLRKRC
jgi:carbon-monoxide dehydrogenase medium subunit